MGNLIHDPLKANTLSIQLVPGKHAPRYEPTEVKELSLDKAVITEKGTTADLPLVDLLLTDADGNKYFCMITGRLINMVSAAIKGVNQRNHGVDEP